MTHLLYLMFRCDFDVIESLDVGGFLWDLNTPLFFLEQEEMRQLDDGYSEAQTSVLLPSAQWAARLARRPDGSKVFRWRFLSGRPSELGLAGCCDASVRSLSLTSSRPGGRHGGGGT